MSPTSRWYPIKISSGEFNPISMNKQAGLRASSMLAISLESRMYTISANQKRAVPAPITEHQTRAAWGWG